MERSAPSLDIIAASQARGGAPLEQPEDSRSSSSTNSPAPADVEESDFYHGNDSESSIGVPNIEDMQVNDDDDDMCLSGVATLPNEILISVFAKLSSTGDLFRCMLVSKRWAKNAVDLLWHRPACTNWKNHTNICNTLALETPFFAYRDFVRRLNLAASALADKINDGSLAALASCTRVERLTLTNCKNLTDSGLVPLVSNSHALLALDISGDEHISDASVRAIAEHCRRLQGLNISGCRLVTNESMIALAESCKYIKRLKLNDCSQLQDSAVLAFAEHCPNILEIDLHQCNQIQNEPVTALISKGRSLRELRLAFCELIDDSAFLSLPPNKTYEHLRILDLTSCSRLTDAAVQKIISAAPRLRNLVLAKCRNITDVAVHAISGLGKNLHYLHLGHCGNITDEAVKRLVSQCNRIRYIDLGCCTLLTDDSVMRLATLPKLKRIGLVKCSNITDESVLALARANHRARNRRDIHGNVVREEYHTSSLERVHLSYCTHLTLKSIIRLLNYCHRLTHLSLTGVTAFLREEFNEFCRPPPSEFNPHQRAVFCVFSGNGVSRLRDYLNSSEEYASLRDWAPGRRHRATQAQTPPRMPTLGVEASYGDDEIEGTEEEEAFEGTENDMPVDQQQPPFAAAFASMVQHGVLLGPPHGPALPPHLISALHNANFATGNGDQHPPPPPPPPVAHSAPVLSHPQTESASISRQPPMIISGFHHGGPSSASAAPVSPGGMTASPASSRASPGPGASTASTRPAPNGGGPPDA